MKKAWALSVIVFLLASTSWAVPVTFIHVADGGPFAGSLSGNPFSGVDTFTITALGDTSAQQSLGSGIFFIDHTSAQIEIPGVGTFTFNTLTRTLVNQGLDSVGFSRAGASGTDLLDEVAAVVGDFASYDLLSSIGPVFGDGRVLQWSLPTVSTTGGDLVFNDGSAENASFQAIVRDGGQVPEPGILLLLGVGLVALYRRRSA